MKRIEGEIRRRILLFSGCSYSYSIFQFSFSLVERRKSNLNTQTHTKGNAWKKIKARQEKRTGE
jgi:hypothetical protein